MSQNRIGQVWTVDRIDEHLRETMHTIFERCCEHGSVDGRIDYHRGADRAGFYRVAKAVVASGYM
jgi:glutamate dehydrogenase (NADP+)